MNLTPYTKTAIVMDNTKMKDEMKKSGMLILSLPCAGIYVGPHNAIP